jgi:VRR-NUC domain-containing protein
MAKANMITAAMNEDDLLLNVTCGTRRRPGLCKLYGLRWFHDHDSRRNPSGLPDLIIVGKRVLYRELKTQTGRLSAAQKEWIADLAAAGQDVDVWRPADWHSHRIARELAELAGIRGAA